MSPLRSGLYQRPLLRSLPRYRLLLVAGVVPQSLFLVRCRDPGIEYRPVVAVGEQLARARSCRATVPHAASARSPARPTQSASVGTVESDARAGVDLRLPIEPVQMIGELLCALAGSIGVVSCVSTRSLGDLSRCHPPAGVLPIRFGGTHRCCKNRAPENRPLHDIPRLWKITHGRPCEQCGWEPLLLASA